MVRPTSLQSTYLTLCLSKGLGLVASGVANEQANQNSQLVTGFTIVAKHAPQNAGTYRTNSLLAQCDVFTDNTFLFAGQRKGAFTSYQNAQTVNLGCSGYTLGFNDATPFNSVQSNNNLHLVGGVKQIYDGISVVEDNFHFWPEMPQGTGCLINLGPDGYLSYSVDTAPNLYQYVVVYEWSDNFGQVQRSGVSVANSISTTTTGQSASLLFPTLPLTAKNNSRAGISISIYRTQLNLPVFYKITDDNNPIVNDPTVDFLLYTDTQSDQAIGANENLYTSSQLSNSAPPACSLISLYQNRLFINTTEDPDVLWYSQNKFEQDQYNTLSLDWNLSFTEGITSQLGQDITAIGLLNNNLAIFKETSVFILQGDGPNALLTSGQFNDAFLLVSDTGCDNPNSLVFITQTPSLPGGLLFKSDKGIYLLGADQSITYIGAPVKQYNNLTITSANLLADSNQIAFTSSEGIILIYNYLFNAWSTWGPNLRAVSATVWQNQLCLLQPNGTVMIQDNTGTVWQDTFTANNTPNVIAPIYLSMTTPWLKFNNNMQNFMAVYNCLLLGEFQGPHLLDIGIAYNGNPANVANVQIDSSLYSNRWGANPFWGSMGLWGDNSFALYQFQINFEKPRCQAIQLTITDKIADGYNADGYNAPNVYNAGYSLNGLVFEVLPFPGGNRVPVSNKVAAKKNQYFVKGQK